MLQTIFIPRSDKEILDEIIDLANNEEILLASSRYGFINGIKYAIKHNANIHYCADLSLRWACSKGYFEIVKILLDNGADKNANFNEPIKFAFKNDHKEIIKLLINNGSKIPNYIKYDI